MKKLYVCPRCGREFKTPGDLSKHKTFSEYSVEYPPKSSPELTDVQMDEMEQLSLRNMIMECRGDVEKLTRGQFRYLLVVGLGRYGANKRRILTPLGLEILNEAQK